MPNTVVQFIIGLIENFYVTTNQTLIRIVVNKNTGLLLSGN